MYWKSVLHDYINTHNQMELNYSMEKIFPLLSDRIYITMQEKRLNAIKEWHISRGVSPKKSETRVKILHLHENEKKVIVELAFKLQTTYLLRNKEYRENRMDQEHIIISRTEDGWIITKIDVKQQERLSTPHHAETMNPVRHKSIPYLNPYILSGPLPGQRKITYDRKKAGQYADRWWDGANPEFIHFEVDCTNYVSQCLYAGNAPMNYTGKRELGWWYRGGTKQEQWSFSWSVSHSLQWFLATSKSGLCADLVESAEQLKIGDVITYDWDGDSKYQHSTIVAAMDANGMPLVNAHTTNSKHRYWDYRDSYAWTEKTKYRFFHIHDKL